MNDSITLTKNDRETIFQGVLLLAKAFVELAAFAGNINESIKEQGDDIIQYSSGAVGGSGAAATAKNAYASGKIANGP